MLELKLKELDKTEAWAAAGIRLPAYDIAQVRKATAERPVWLHFGAGNIFRGFIAVLQQQLLDQGLTECGVIAAETYDYDIIDKLYKPCDELCLLAGLRADGGMENQVVASICDSIRGGLSHPEEGARLRAVFASPSLQLVSFTITEKGYALGDMKGELLDVVRRDMEAGPKAPKHAMSVVASLLYHRYREGAAPLALVSMDNCSHNGEKLRDSVLTIARAWAYHGDVDQAFLTYLEDEARVSFPWSMIDKITPRPAETVKEALEELGVIGMDPIVTSKNTYIAPFVNAEIPQYLVVEDGFPNGRPPLEQAGVFFTDRETVNDTERMKVTTCLNPLHTALAVFGCLLGYGSISAEMEDPLLLALVERIGYGEGLTVVTDPGIIDPQAFIREVLEVRLPNPNIPDTPQRIACDTSQKMAIRFGETVKAYLADPELDPQSLTGIPLVVAGWLRYLLGTGDDGAPIVVSTDPLLPELQGMLRGIRPGNPDSLESQLREVLANKMLFGVDLCQVGLAPKIEEMLRLMLAGPGAVRATLAHYLEADRGPAV